MSDFYLSLPPIGGGSGGAVSWKDPVTTIGDLPSVGNTVGDARVVTDNNAVFVWGSDDAWHAPSGGGAVWGGITGTLSDQTDLQTALNAKAPVASPTFTGTIGTPLTVSRAMVTDASGNLSVSAATATELSYVNGVTSAIQTQFAGKLSLSGGTMTGQLKMDAFSIMMDTSNLCFIRSLTLGVISIGNSASSRSMSIGSQCVSHGDLTNDLNGFFVLGDATHRWKSVYTYAYTCSEAVNTTGGSVPPTMGLATLAAGTVTISNTGVTTSSRIYLTIQDPNGGTVGSVYISARTAGTSFTITSTSATDTSKVAWLLVEAV